MDFDPDKYIQEKQKATPAFDPDAYLAEKAGSKPTGMLSTLGHVLGGGGKAVLRGLDYATGAPARAALGAGLAGKNPLSALVEQYGKSPETAPTDEDNAVSMGFSNKPSGPAYGGKAGRLPQMPSSAEIAAVPLGFASNLLNVLPGVGAAAKGIGRAAPILSDLASGASEAAGKMGSKIVGALSDKPASAVHTMMSRGPEIAQAMDQAGHQVPVLADHIKQGIVDSIKSKKKELSDSITGALNAATSTNAPPVPSTPILAKLQKAKDSLNPHYNPGEISQIDEMMKNIQSTSPDGYLSLQNLFDTRNYLQTMSKGSFVKNGSIFMNGEKAAKAANDARGAAAEALHAAAPTIKQADAIYTDLHDIDDKMAPSLLGEGKAETTLASAGGHYQNHNRVLLDRLGEITGTNPGKQAELLHSAQQFEKHPSIRSSLLKFISENGPAVSSAGGAATRSAPIIEGAFGRPAPLRSVASPDDAMKRRLGP